MAKTAVDHVVPRSGFGRWSLSYPVLSPEKVVTSSMSIEVDLPAPQSSKRQRRRGKGTFARSRFSGSDAVAVWKRAGSPLNLGHANYLLMINEASVGCVR